MPIIVIIEDDTPNRDFFEAALQSSGYDVTVAPNAEEGLVVVRQVVPDLVVMNTGLPGMNGLQATQIIKDDPQLAHIRVLAVTSQDGEDALRRIFAAGSDDYLTKPFGVAALRSTVERLLNG